MCSSDLASTPVVIASDQSAVPASQSGTWTVQPGNTANTTPWLATINQGGNSAVVTASNALKVDGSAVTQPVSGTVSITANSAINLAQVGGTSVTLGQNQASASLPVVLASDQSEISVRTLNPIQIANADGSPIAVNATGSDINSITNPVSVNPITVISHPPVTGTVTANQGSPPWTVNMQVGGTVPSATAPLYVMLSNGSGMADLESLLKVNNALTLNQLNFTANAIGAAGFVPYEAPAFIGG